MEGIEITPLRAVRNIYTVAKSLNEHLVRKDNVDIIDDFPGTVERYTGSVKAVAGELLTTAESCSLENGKQIFIASIGNRAVGLAGIQRIDEVPEGIPAESPVLTSFVCNPYRRRGIASQSLKVRLDYADAFFGALAWTRIRQDNTASMQLIEKHGLELHSTDEKYAYYVDSRL